MVIVSANHPFFLDPFIFAFTATTAPWPASEHNSLCSYCNLSSLISHCQNKSLQ